MTSDITLELDHDGVRLVRDTVEVGAVRLEDPLFAAKLATLRKTLGNEEPLDVEVLLPGALVLFIETGEADEGEIEARAVERSGCTADELVIGQKALVAAAVERATLEEARDFVVAHGFNPASFAAQRTRDPENRIFFRLDPVPVPTFRSSRASTTDGASDDQGLDAGAHDVGGAAASAIEADRTDEPTTTGDDAPNEPASAPERAQPKMAIKAPEPPVTRASSEAEALTVFGARNQMVASRGFGPVLGLTAVLAVGVLLAVYSLIDAQRPDEVVVLDQSVERTLDPVAETTPDAPDDNVGAIDREASPDQVVRPPAKRPELETAAASSQAPPPGLSIGLALPQPSSPPASPPPSELAHPQEPEIAGVPGSFLPPPPPGTVFDMDDKGLVRPTEEGATTPTGIVVYTGPPSPSPPARTKGSAEIAPEPESSQDDASVAPEPAAPPLNGQLRPRPRPVLEPTAVANEDETLPADAPEDADDLVANAIASDVRDFDALAEQARSAASAATASLSATRAARPPPPEPEGQLNVAVQPSFPTRASVADRATISNGIKLDRVNLIGVYGSASDRRALIRLPTGRYLKVKVGDRVDGGRVAAIQASRVEYVKGGRTYSLTMPNG
jgi:hypothetical protein